MSSLPPLALARSRKQGAAWGRRREWDEREEEIDELLAQSLSAESLQAMRESGGREIRAFDLPELARLRFDGAKAAWPFLGVFAGLLFNTEYKALVGSSQAIADMLGAFGAPVSEMCVRRALAGLEKAGLICIAPVFKRYAPDAPFVSKVEAGRALLVRETGRLFTAGPILLRVFAEHRALARRKKQGCSKRPTLPDPIQELRKTYRADARASSSPQTGSFLPPPIQEPKSAEAASPLKVSAPQAPTITKNAPSALPEEAAFKKGESAPPPKPAAIAPQHAQVASSAVPATDTASTPQTLVESPWRKLWVTADIEEKFTHHCRVNRRHRGDVLAEAISAFLGFSRPRPLTSPTPQRVTTPAASAPAASAPVDEETIDLARTIFRSMLLPSSSERRVSSGEAAHLARLLESGNKAEVAAQLACPAPQPTSLVMAPQPEFHEPTQRASARLLRASTEGLISSANAAQLWRRIEEGDAVAVLHELQRLESL